jgi:hemerythrin-like metal-binding protein
MTYITEIDSQHRVLINLINKLNDAIDEGRDKEVLGVVLSELVDYTVNHFAMEERHMDKFNYPASAAHKHEHEMLRQKVLTLKKQFDAGQSVVTIEVMKFLKEWLRTHIIDIDKKMGSFLEAKGVK